MNVGATTEGVGTDGSQTATEPEAVDAGAVAECGGPYADNIVWNDNFSKLDLP